MDRVHVNTIVLILLLSILFYFPQENWVQGGPTYIYDTSLNSNTTWILSGSPYIIKDNLTVPAGLWLSIEPGVEVRFDMDTMLRVYGTLYAIGNESYPVVFTSNKTVPGPGNWASIRIEEEANVSASIISYAKIEYSVIGVNAQGSTPIIMNTSIENVLGEGINLKDSYAYIVGNVINNTKKGIEGANSNPVVDFNTISNCEYYALKFDQCNPTIRNNTISESLTGIELKRSYGLLNGNNIFNTKYGIEMDRSSHIIITDSTLNNNDYGIYSANTKKIELANCSFSGNKNGFYSLNSSFYQERTMISQSTDNDFWIKDKSKVILVDSEFDTTNNKVEMQSNIEVLNYLVVMVEDETGIPYNGTEVEIIDNSKLIATLYTDENGTTDPILLCDLQIIDNAIIVENITTINVTHSKKFFGDNPRNVDMSYSHTEIFRRMNLPPMIEITYPADNYRFNGTIMIEGTSSDTDGNVTKVEVLFSEGPYIPVTNTGINWSTWGFELNTTFVPDGYYLVIINATDNEGMFSTAEIDIIVDNFPNTPPSINISSPKSQQIVNHTVLITGFAFDNDGIIKSVEMQIDQGPWQKAHKIDSDWFTWMDSWDSSIYSEGNHTINARSKDDEEVYSAIYCVNITVNNLDNFLPIVSIASHRDDEEVSAVEIIKGDSLDEDGKVAEVEIQIDDGAWQHVKDTGKDYSTWDFEWDTTLYPNGEHEVNLRAIDNENGTSEIVTISLIVNNGGNMPPTVKITSHNKDEILSGSVTFGGESSDSDGKVELVQIKIDEETWKNATNVDESWSFWNFYFDTTLYPNGEHIISAKSIDNTSAKSTTDSITFFINNGGNMPPEVYITSHNNGEKVHGAINLKGIAHDRDGFIQKVEIQIDEGIWLSAQEISAGWSAWSFFLETTLYSNGVHIVKAKCYDNNSLESTIHLIEITINNGGNLPPIIEITSHNDGDIVSSKTIIKGLARDTDGDIKDITIKIGNGTWNSVTKTVMDWSKWSFQLDTAKYENGDYIITVKVTDNLTAWSTDSIILNIENEEPAIEPKPVSELSMRDLFLLFIGIFIILILIIALSVRSYRKRFKKLEDELERQKRKRKKRKKKIPDSQKEIQRGADKIDETVEELEKFEELLDKEP